MADGYAGSWDSTHALAVLKRDGSIDGIPELAHQAAASCRPCDRSKLVQRLTALGMVMSPNRPSAEATMWVHEMARLLSDLAEDVVLEAIDAHQLECKFLPTVAEIRERADPTMTQRRKDASRLDAMARLIASGAPIPELAAPAPPKPRAPDQPMTAAQAEEMNAILGRIGAATRYRPDGSRYETETSKGSTERPRPLRAPTRNDYIALGVDPAILDQISDTSTGAA